MVQRSSSDVKSAANRLTHRRAEALAAVSRFIDADPDPADLRMAQAFCFGLLGGVPVPLPEGYEPEPTRESEPATTTAEPAPTAPAPQAPQAAPVAPVERVRRSDRAREVIAAETMAEAFPGDTDE